MRTRLLRFAAAILALAAVATAGAAEAPAPATTLTGTIVGRGSSLARGPGEPYTARTELAAAQAGRETRRTELVFFGQLTDVHIVDEETPARVELLDRYGGSLISAYRPYEGLLSQVLEQMVVRLRGARSPLTGRALQLVVATGDNADNTQLNELRWFVRTLDGGVVDPNSGVAGTCGVRTASRYEGVRGGAYYDPDSRKDGSSYRRLPDFPGLFERMNVPFRSPGLGVPWYAAVGNHDALIQGNVASNPIFAQAAGSCNKPTSLANQTQAQIAALAAGGITAEERAQIIRLVTQDVVLTILDPANAKGRYTVVRADPERRLTTRQEMLQVLTGHGISDGNVASGKGNYAFAPAPGLRFVVLDTAADSGDSGAVDDVQFRWLDGELAAADGAHELAVVFAHHPLESITQGPHPGTAAACPGAAESVQCLLLRHRSVVAFVTGHQHRNRIEPLARGDGSGGFWQITTDGDVEWPMQARLLDLFDNRDGTISLFTTIVDSPAPAQPGAAPRKLGRTASAAEVARLASIARLLAFDDPQAQRNRGGTRADRNVELLVPDPRG